MILKINFDSIDQFEGHLKIWEITYLIKNYRLLSGSG